MAAIPIIAQTIYAELVDRCATAAFDDAFQGQGNFVVKTIKGRQGQRRYWYFQEQTEEGRKQRYVGPETAELLERIAKHKSARNDENERRSLVAALVRTHRMPQPVDEIGKVIAALARVGAFRLRAVLVGTSAYQTYAPMLGIRLPSPAVRTDDIAQFKNISIAIEDEVPPLLETLRSVDPTFVPVPHQKDGRRSTSYRSARGVRVDFLTPNEGAETDEPQELHAQGTDAQPLRFLDFLIHDCIPAVVLHGSGILAQVPLPERYAIHKLIVARRRHASSAKKPKDMMQAQGLIAVLAHKRPFELRAAWNEAYGRGEKWKSVLLESLVEMSSEPRDTLLKTLNWTRDKVTGLALRFDPTHPRYDFDRDTVIFTASDDGGPIRCAISREALEDHFDADDLSYEGRLERFRVNRSTIERLVSKKYLSWPIEEAASILIKIGDVEVLRATRPG